MLRIHQGDSFVVIVSLCVFCTDSSHLNVRSWLKHCVAGSVIVYDEHAGTKLTLIAYEIYNYGAGDFVQMSLPEHSLTLCNENKWPTCWWLSSLASRLAPWTYSLETDKHLLSAAECLIYYIFFPSLQFLGPTIPSLYNSFFFVPTDSSHEQSWPFPGENPALWEAFEILSF